MNPSLAQMHLRFLSLKVNKKLLVPSPALGEDFFYFIDPTTWVEKKTSKLYKAASKKGAKLLGLPLNENWDGIGKADLVVVASVAVSPKGVSFLFSI